jgi:hypothetical protein
MSKVWKKHWTLKRNEDTQDLRTRRILIKSMYTDRWDSKKVHGVHTFSRQKMKMEKEYVVCQIDNRVYIVRERHR